MNRRELMAAAGAACLVPAFAGVQAASASQPMHATLRIGPPRSGAGNHRWATIEAGSVTGALRGVAASGRVDWYVDPASGAVELSVGCRIVDAAGNAWILADATCAAGAPAGGWPSTPRLAQAANPARRFTLLEGRIDARRFREGWLELHAYPST